MISKKLIKQVLTLMKMEIKNNNFKVHFYSEKELEDNYLKMLRKEIEYQQDACYRHGWKNTKTIEEIEEICKKNWEEKEKNAKDFKKVYTWIKKCFDLNDKRNKEKDIINEVYKDLNETEIKKENKKLKPNIIKKLNRTIELYNAFNDKNYFKHDYEKNNFFEKYYKMNEIKILGCLRSYQFKSEKDIYFVNQELSKKTENNITILNFNCYIFKNNEKINIKDLIKFL